MNEVARRCLIWGFVLAWYAAMLCVAILVDPSALVAFAGFPVVGAIILTSRPRNGVGRILIAFSLASVLVAAQPAATSLLGSGVWTESIGQALTWPFWLLLPTIALVFPSGRIDGRFGRLTGWTTLVVATVLGIGVLVDPEPLFESGAPNPFGWKAAAAPLSVLNGPISSAAQALLALAMLVDLVIRWRGSVGVARLQFRWFGFALALIIPLIAVVALVLTVVPDSSVPVIAGTSGAVVLNLIPISILIAVTRHGLYEIDRIISRTVSYALVTVLVVGVYVGMVLGLGALLPALPSVGVALATLAAAALFLPALRGVQRVIDRRFDRERYNATLVVDGFGERLRTSTDPAAAAPDLVSAVEQALQPASVGLWTTGAR